MNITEAMATVLAASECDLGDEREPMRVLQKSGYELADILAHVDAATERARVLRQQPGPSNLIQAVAVLAAIVVGGFWAGIGTGVI